MISSIRYKSKSSILSQSSTFIPNKRFIFWILIIKATLLAVLLILPIIIKEGMLEELKHSTNDIRLSSRLRSGRRLSWLYSWWVSYRKFPNKIQCKRNKKYTNFNQVRDNIQKLTDDIAGTGANIVDDPIKLKIFSVDCPDLTIIDLPGITRIDIKGQKDGEKITT